MSPDETTFLPQERPSRLLSNHFGGLVGFELVALVVHLEAGYLPAVLISCSVIHLHQDSRFVCVSQVMYEIQESIEYK